MSTARWNDRADQAQGGLTEHFGGLRTGSLHNTAPQRLRSLTSFNFWWLAHAVEARVDAYERSRRGEYLAQAEAIYARIRARNGGTLFNDYFDDMSWLALAALRLFDATSDRRYLTDARSLWQHIVTEGFNSQAGPSAAGPSIGWRRQQLTYKNAPTNGSFGIVSARLFARTGDRGFETLARSSLHFLETTLVDETTGFVADGINRQGDGRVDDQWRFTYCQGLYIGALVEASAWAADSSLLERAVQTARSTITLLARDGVFRDENVDLRSRGGADIGLFKGIFFRFLSNLVLALSSASTGSTGAQFTEALTELATFIDSNASALWASFEPSRLASDDYLSFATGTVSLTTELSAVITLEARARLARNDHLAAAR